MCSAWLFHLTLDDRALMSSIHFTNLLDFALDRLLIIIIIIIVISIPISYVIPVTKNKM